VADHWNPYPQNDEDERRAREQAQNHPRSHAETFGEDLGPSTFTDLGPSYHPDDKSTAARMAGNVKQRRQAAATARAKEAAEIRTEIDAEQQNPLRGIPTAEIMGRAYLRHGRGQDDERS
jgi:hypothetical protein